MLYSTVHAATVAPPSDGEYSSLASWVMVILCGAIAALFSLYVKSSKEQARAVVDELRAERMKGDESRKELVELHKATMLHIADNSEHMHLLYHEIKACPLHHREASQELIDQHKRNA